MACARRWPTARSRCPRWAGAWMTIRRTFSRLPPPEGTPWRSLSGRKYVNHEDERVGTLDAGLAVTGPAVPLGRRYNEHDPAADRNADQTRVPGGDQLAELERGRRNLRLRRRRPVVVEHFAGPPDRGHVPDHDRLAGLHRRSGPVDQRLHDQLGWRGAFGDLNLRRPAGPNVHGRQAAAAVADVLSRRPRVRAEHAQHVHDPD